MTSDIFLVETVRSQLRSILNQAVRKSSLMTHAALMAAKGDLIDAAGPSPLHYPALQAAAQAALKYIPVKPGETVITNDPYSGNTRFCDLFLLQSDGRFSVALQISLPELLNKKSSKLFTSAEDEGFRIPPTLLESRGQINPEIIQYLTMSGVSKDVLLDHLNAAKTTLFEMLRDLTKIEKTVGRQNFEKVLSDLETYSEKAMRKALHDIPDGEYQAFDILENDGIDQAPLRIQCRMTVQEENLLISFTGTSKQTKGPFNCTSTLTMGACFWTLRGLVKHDIPVNKGLFKTFSIEAPDGTLLNARYPGALLGGYYETTLRTVDVLLLLLSKAMPRDIPSQNGGSSAVNMFWIGEKFLVDQLGCGSGASGKSKGSNVVFSGLHNHRASSIETLESLYPIRVTHSRVRESSGGSGKFEGGDGITRGYQFLENGQALLLSDRRSTKARGSFGGASGLPGEDLLVSGSEKAQLQNQKGSVDFSSGDILIVNSPGGGGWGQAPAPQTEEEDYDDDIIDIEEE